MIKLRNLKVAKVNIGHWLNWAFALLIDEPWRKLTRKLVYYTPSQSDDPLRQWLVRCDRHLDMMEFVGTFNEAYEMAWSHAAQHGPRTGVYFTW